MSQTYQDDPKLAPTASKNKRSKNKRGKWSFTSILVIIIALAGGIVFSYPIAAPWITNVIQADQIVHMQNTIKGMDPELKQELLDKAHYYNEHLPLGPLRDPFVINQQGEAVSIEEGRADYNQQLVVNKDRPDDPISRITIPSIDVDLPIYRGTEDAVLSKGVGHFYGSGLPVGGTSVHTVLTAHSGYVDATLFDNVDKMEIGDVFAITTLGDVHYYRVDHIVISLPNESEFLRQVPGKDYVTLVTCTPKLVNSHRLLVRGERIADPEKELDEGYDEVVTAPNPGLPWWLIIAVGPAIGAYYLVRPRRLQNNETTKTQTPDQAVPNPESE